MRFARAVSEALAVLLVGVLLAPALAHAQYFGRNKVQYEAFNFKLLATEHFDIYYYADERQMAEQAGRMAERWYGRLSHALDMELKGRQPLILYASHPDFEQTNAVPGQLDESTGGVTESFKRRIVLPLAGSLAETDHVIGHEIVHAFQFDLRKRGDTNPFDPGAQLPLWFVEGMAEYLSVGPSDPHTAMWIRDAAARDKLPGYQKLDDPRFFPYRYGQAFWAHVASRHGESSVGKVLKSATGKGVTVEQAFNLALGTPADSLVRDWHRAVKSWASRAGADRRESADGRAIIAPRGEVGRLNVAPSLSPDGTRLAFLSERDPVSIELYVADVATGKVLRRLTRAAVDPHLQSLQFIHSAGGWSPDGRRIAIATVSRGKPTLALLDAETGRSVQRIPFPTLGEIFNPTWSPDGRRVAFSAIAGGATDLFTVELESRKLERLTQDLFADLHPAWSPDGRSLAFATDRHSTQLEALDYGNLRLALLDLDSRAIRQVSGADRGKNINPQWSRDGASLYFLSDRSGITNAYRVPVAGGEALQVTDFSTGVSGITALSPALSVAREADRLVFSAYGEGGYTVRSLEGTEALGGFAPRAVDPLARLLPGATEESIAAVTATRDSAALPDPAKFSSKRYRSGLSLDFVSQTSLAVGAGAGGFAVGGGSAFFWSDMLGNHNLATILQVSSAEGGVGRNLGAVVAYQNLRNRWNWGVQGYQIPYFTRTFQLEEGTLGGEPVVRESDVRSWQIERAIEGSVSYPLSRAQRVELAGGYRNIDFESEVRTLVYSQIDGLIFSDVTTPGAGDSIPSLDLFTASAATVYDNSVFGGTSPARGQRYRLELAPVVGDLQFASVLADYRRYEKIAGPLGAAARVVHLGRYGRDSESSRISQLFIGYPWLIRGYDSPSFTLEECGGGSGQGDCPTFDRLFGSRMALANFELRLPIIGGLGLVRAAGVPPMEVAAFYDAGVAWTNGDEARLLGGGRPGVSSYGTTFRVNVLGFLIAEIAYVHPNDRPLKGWYWLFNLQPGF